MFNIDAPSGELQGQSAVIKLWEFEDGTQGGPGAAPPPTSTSTTEGGSSGSGNDGPAVTSEEEIAAAEAAVSEQGAKVRELKEVQGLSNSSEEVKAAVEELLRRKAVLEGLRK